MVLIPKKRRIYSLGYVNGAKFELIINDYPSLHVKLKQALDASKVYTAEERFYVLRRAKELLEPARQASESGV